MHGIPPLPPHAQFQLPSEAEAHLNGRRGPGLLGTACVPSHLKGWLKDTNLNGIRIPVKSMSIINQSLSRQRGHWKQ